MVPDDLPSDGAAPRQPQSDIAEPQPRQPQSDAVEPPINWASVIQHFHLPKYEHDHPPVQNANDLQEQQLSKMDRLAVAITDKVGSFGFFLIIFCWTVLWTGYNILASEVPALHWKSFDPFPAFVAYLLISNVIQILLMPLIMVGQNLQNRHAEIRAELDFQINRKAEQEVAFLMRHMERNTTLLLHLMQHVDCRITEEEMRAIQSENELARKLAAMLPGAKS
jgi:uncharacterized membrane protein